MGMKKIISIDRDGIKLEDGYSIIDCHEQDCCESVYADWNYLKDFLKIDEYDSFIIDIDLNKSIQPVEEAGFRIIIKDVYCGENQYFVPCYDCQNGYYSDELKLQVLKNKKVMQELDITSTTIYQYK